MILSAKVKKFKVFDPCPVAGAGTWILIDGSYTVKGGGKVSVTIRGVVESSKGSVKPVIQEKSYTFNLPPVAKVKPVSFRFYAVYDTDVALKDVANITVEVKIRHNERGKEDSVTVCCYYEREGERAWLITEEAKRVKT